MSDHRVAAAAALALAAGPWMFVQAFRHLRTWRLMRNTPTARIRSMAMGVVELNGEVIPRSGVEAPFSGRPCAFWDVDIAVRGRRNQWSVLHHNQSGGPFYLRDDTGIALVLPHGADCHVTHGRIEECSGLNLPDVYADYIRDHASLLLATLGRLSVLRFRERTLEEGQVVYLLGSAAPRAAEQVVSEGEWLATGTEDVRATRLRSLDAELVAVVRQGRNEPTFIISEQSERELTLGLQWKSHAMLLAGPLITVFGLGYWLLVLSGKMTW
jgi:E3 ubiquitin ligase